VNALIFLIVFPLCIAGLALVLPLGNALRRTIGVVANIVLCVVPIYLLVTYLDQGPVYFRAESHAVNMLMLAVEVFIAAFIIYISLRAKQYLPVLLVVVQSVIMVTFELTVGSTMEVEHNLFVDKFSIIMALIVGIIGSAICLYGIGYLPEYHEHHKEVKDRRRYFAFLMYLFLSAMFGIVFSNSLIWLYFFWEITTICSALLIGYRNDKQSIESQFRALKMNLLGGLGFVIGLVYLYNTSHTMELDKLIRLDQTQDMEELGQIAERTKRTAVVYIGGGVPKDTIQLATIIKSLAEGGEDETPHDYAIQITTEMVIPRRSPMRSMTDPQTGVLSM
jgi:ech hydrogenase subunit A